MKSVGIDIGSSYIKVVEIQTTSKSFQLVQYFIHPLNSSNASDQEIEIIEFLRNLVTKYDVTATRFNLALRQDRVVIRNKIFPFTERLKINKSLAFELEEEIPFSADNSVFDSKIVQYRGSAAEVLVCATPKPHIQHFLQVIEDGGIEPYLVSTEGTAFANIFENWNEVPRTLPALPVISEEGQGQHGKEKIPMPERPIQMVLNMGHTRTLVCAFEGKSLVGVRSIMWGGASIVDAIGKKYNLPPKEAQKEMELKAFILTNNQNANFEAKVFSDLIAKCIRDLVRDLQLTILEFRSEFNGQIQKIDMTGGLSNIQGLGPFLTQHLEVPVNKIQILDSFSSSTLFEKTDITQSRLGVAIGLAIEGLKKPRNPAVNFLKGDLARQNHFWRLFLNQWAFTLKVATAAVILLYIWTSLRATLSENLVEKSKDSLKAQARMIAGMKPREATDIKVKAFIKEANKKAEDVKKLISISSMNSALDILKKITDSVPSKSIVNLDVTHLQIHDTSVVIQGYVKNAQELANLEQTLRNVSVDNKINPAQPTLPASTAKQVFAYTFFVDRNLQKESL